MEDGQHQPRAHQVDQTEKRAHQFAFVFRVQGKLWRFSCMFLAPRASTCFARNDVHRNLLMCTCHLTALHCLPIKQCPVCMGILRNTWTVMECMHRFCGNCIQRCLRGGKQECPSCRVHVGSRRSLRQDHNFDALIRTVFKNVDAYEAEQNKCEVAFVASKAAEVASSLKKGIEEQIVKKN